MNSINYHQIGEVLELFQHFEEKFKLFTIKHGIEKSDDKRSLSNMATFLLKTAKISEYDYSLIKKIIELRNYFIHRLFLDDIDKINEIVLNTKECILNAIEVFK